GGVWSTGRHTDVLSSALPCDRTLGAETRSNRRSGCSQRSVRARLALCKRGFQKLRRGRQTKVESCFRVSQKRAACAARSRGVWSRVVVKARAYSGGAAAEILRRGVRRRSLAPALKGRTKSDSQFGRGACYKRLHAFERDRTQSSGSRQSEAPSVLA